MKSRLHYLRGIVLAAACACLAAPSAIAQSRAAGDEWNRLMLEAQTLHREKDYSRATVLLKKAVEIAESRLGPEHPNVATSLNNLAVLYKDQGRFADAETYFRRSLAIEEKTLGPEHPEVATSLNNLAMLHQGQGLYTKAEPLLRRALAIEEKTLGPEHPEIATTLNNLALLYSHQGRYADAEPLLRRALAIREKMLGSEHRAVATSMNSLAALYQSQGRYADAVPLYQRALAIREKVLGLKHPDVATTLNNLAVLYSHQGRYADAEPLYRRALAIRESALGPEHRDVATTLINQAELYRSLGRYTEAEPLFRRALEISEKALGQEHPELPKSLNSLAGLYRAQGRYADAEPLYRRALAVREKTLGSEHPDVATSLNNLAVLYNDQGRYADAEPLSLRSLEINEKALGPDHRDVAASRINLAAHYDHQNRSAEALPHSRRGYEILRRRFDTAATTGMLTEQKLNRGRFTFHIQLLGKTGGAGSAAESFEAAQLAQTSSVGQSVAQMAARFAAQGGDLAGAIRQRQDTTDAHARADKALIDALGAPPDKANPQQVSTLRDQLAKLERTLAEQARTIAQRFPEYDALVSPSPITLIDAQKLLRSDEGLLFYMVDRRGVFAWAVRSDRAVFRRLDISDDELNRSVAKLRERLDPEQNPNAAPFDYTSAHALYLKIFATLEPTLAGASHVIVVADGALQSLPLTVLIAKQPTDVGQSEWLADRFAFSVVPSVSALRALRTFTRGAPGTEPFVGFGDPVLGGQAGDKRRLAARALFARGAVAGDGHVGIADVAAIRNAPPLPETADELKAIGRILNAPASSLHLRSEAAETQAKRMDLARYRIVAFATHGVMAGELSGVAEPGLILTPPDKGTELDDGYLSASEVAQLKLNADWVLLSACNTSAPDGAPGAEGLSGLAKGFFYAGARSLLVSNWYVVSDAAVKITTEMLKRYQADPRLGKAEALRQSMAQLRGNPEYSHPLFWAPFMVVGEGGR